MWVFNFKPSPLCSRLKSSRYLLDRRFDESQSRNERRTEKKNFSPLLESKFRRPARSTSLCRPSYSACSVVLTVLVALLHLSSLFRVSIHSTMTTSVVKWSEFQATNPEVRVRFPALSDFLRSSGSGTGSTQPREYNSGATWKKKYRLRFLNSRIRP
jgi:hypothetical protein